MGKSLICCAASSHHACHINPNLGASSLFSDGTIQHRADMLSKAGQCSQVPHPDPDYQGFSDPHKCPDFIADFDCRAAYIESQYAALRHQARESL